MANIYFTTMQIEFLLRASKFYKEYLDQHLGDSGVSLDQDIHDHLIPRLTAEKDNAIRNSKPVAPPKTMNQDSKHFVGIPEQKKLDIKLSPAAQMKCLTRFQETKICGHEKWRHTKVSGKPNSVCMVPKCGCDSFYDGSKKKESKKTYNHGLDFFNIRTDE